MINHWRTYLVMLLATLPIASQAVVEPMPPECSWTGAYNEATETWPRRNGSYQWPNGYAMDLVEYGPNNVDWKAELGAEINECATGRLLVIESSYSANDEQYIRLFDFLDSQRESTNTLDQVRNLARNAGFSATMFTDDEERCGCATFYPELRGDKTPFDADKYYGETE